MSAALTSTDDGVHTANASSSPSEASSRIQGASKPTPLVSLGHSLSDIINIRTPLELALTTIPKNAPNRQELTDAVHTCITGCQELLANTTQVPETTKTCADNVYRLLQAAHVHLQNRHLYGKRAQVKGKVNSFLGRSATPPPATYYLDIPVAFNALKNSLLPSIAEASQNDPANSHPTSAATKSNRQDTATGSALVPPVALERDPPAEERILEEPVHIAAKPQAPADAPKKDSAWGTIVDTIEGGLGLLSTVTDFIPAPAGPIVKLMAATGLTIIEMLKDMADNQEEATDLGRYIGMLIQIAGRFLERPAGGTGESCDAETTKQLQFFLDTLKALETNLVKLKAQGRFKQGVSHKTNKDDLKQWETRISRAFTTLQTQLSLDSIRLLTRMNASDALRERDRLIGLLGDGDIGATEKAANATDLMCLPGTRTEVLDQVDQWIADPSGSRIFWISGVAGCGKSAVAATIAGRPRGIPTSTAVFYFVRGNQERNKRVLCSLSRQLAQFGHGSLEQFVLSSVKAKPDIATSHFDTQFQHLIVDPLKKLVPGSPPIILVVDALDEWNNHSAILSLVRLIQQTHKELPPTIRFVLTSRNEPHLVRSLDSTSLKSLVTRYPLDAVLKTDAGRDIRRYITKRFATISAESDIAADGKPWPEGGDIESLVMLSDGLFQWAATVMSYIGAMGSAGRLRNIIKNPERYRGLDNLYRGVLEGSPEEEMDDRVPRLLQAVLGAILTAPVPINATTIVHLCCDEIDSLEEITELIQHEILPRLASMFIIPKDPTQPINISHKSVLDYLTNRNRCTDPRFYTDLVVQNDHLLRVCLRLMESILERDVCGINNPSKLNEEVQHQVGQHIPSWLRYSCQHWATYAQASGGNPSTESRRRLGDFSRKHLLHWLEVMSLIGLTKEVTLIARNIEIWLSTFPSLSPAEELTQRLWSDTQQFVIMFEDPISTAAAHIYISALRLAPTDTPLAKQFSKTTRQSLRVTGGLLGKQWPSPTWTGRGHTKEVSCALFSPDGRSILSTSIDNTLRIWDAESGDQKGGTLKGHTNAVKYASFSADGSTILSWSWDETLRVWDAGSGTQKGETLKGHTHGVWCASFSPDGRTILSGSRDSTLRIWDAGSGAQRSGTIKGHTDVVTCASFSPDGRTILSGSRDSTLRMWDAESCIQKGRTMEGHTALVTCASFSPNGKTILSGSADSTLRIWDTELGTQNGGALEGHTKGVWCATFSPDGRTILSGSCDNTLRIWDAETGAQKGRTLQGHRGPVECALFSPDGKTILSGSYDKTLRIWDAESGSQKGGPLEGHSDMVMCASFSPDGRRVLSGSMDKTLRIWDADSGALRMEPRNGHISGVECFVFSPDGGTVVSSSYDKTIRPWNAETGFLKGEPLSVEGTVSGLSFSEDGLTLIGKRCDGSSQEWDFTRYIPTKSDPTRRAPVFEGSVSPEGWIFHRDIRWFWVPFSYADWLLCGSRLALRRERVVYIFDVSEIMYIVE